MSCRWPILAGVTLLPVLCFSEARAVKGQSPKSRAAQSTPASKPAAHPAKAPAKLNAAAAEKAQALRWLRGLPIRHLAAQLIMTECYGEAPPRNSKDFRNFVKLVRDVRVGGIIVINRVTSTGVRPAEPHAMAAFLNRMQKLARIPLIVGADFERGASMRVNNTVKFPHMMAYGATGEPAFTRQLGLFTAREARALGVHWVFAPDSDVNNNPDNPIINTRSFGESPEAVAMHVRAYIEGAHSDPAARVLVTAKHFPGHGDTSVDSHMNLPAITVDRERLNQVELVPFRAAIQAGVDSVMTAHLNVPSLEPAAVPATVSRAILSDLLREQLHFEGLVVTDAMNMQGLTSAFPGGEAAVRALEAGADVLLMPPDPAQAVDAIAAAIKQGRLTRARLLESATRLLSAKARVGLHRKRLVSLESIPDVLESEEAEAHALDVAAHAITLVKDDKRLVPLSNPKNACAFILAESRNAVGGRRLLDEFKARGLSSVLLDPLMPEAELEQAAASTSACTKLILAAFVSSSAYRGNVVLPGALSGFVEKQVARGLDTVMIVFGSPYLLRHFPGVSAYLATFSTAPSSEAAAAKALFGETPIGGHLPVTIPGYARIGDGLKR